MPALFKILSFILIFLPLFSKGQKNFVDGYLIKKNGDTVKGIIDDKNWYRNPGKIAFRKSAAHEIEFMSPDEVSEIGSYRHEQTEIYRSFTVDLDVSELNLEKMSDNAQPNLVSKNLFLMLLAEGKTELYQYVDLQPKKHFFIKTGNQIQELIYKKYYTDQNHNKLSVNEGYKNQLLNAFKDCDRIDINMLKATKYEERPLTAVFENYNNCSGNTNSYKHKEDKIKIKFGLAAGGSLSSLNMKGPLVKNTDFDASKDAAFGVSVNFYLPRSNYKNSIYAELLYKDYSTNSKYTDYINNDHYNEYAYAFGAPYIKLSTAYRYNLVNAKFKPFFNIGITNSYALSDVENSMVTSHFFSTVETEKTTVLAARKYEQGLMAGIGMTLNQFKLELRGEITNGFSGTDNTSTTVNTGYLLLHYEF